MSTTHLPGLCLRICNWIARTSTAFHLWCAERELRLAETSELSSDLRQARERNLATLREYRQRGEFPHNRHDANHSVPCFVDSDGRQCAVACLMHASGDAASALVVAQTANFARIRQMQFPELDAWAAESGLTKEELARIQPGYPPTVEQIDSYSHVMLAIGAVGALACLSILVNILRLFVAYAKHLPLALVGVILGSVLLGIGIYADFPGSGYTPKLDHPLHWYCQTAVVLGAVTILMAILSYGLRAMSMLIRSKNAPPPASGPIAAPDPLPNSTGIKEMDGWN